MERLGRFFSIRKSYFLQVQSLILVGTLEKYQFLILIVSKAFLICGVGYGRLILADADRGLWKSEPRGDKVSEHGSRKNFVSVYKRSGCR